MISRDVAAGSGFGSGLRIVHSARVDVGGVTPCSTRLSVEQGVGDLTV